MFNQAQKIQLLQIARQSISWGLEHGQSLPLDIEKYEPDLVQHRASFVTLFKNNQLRGCIGSLDAHQPLVKDISKNAYASAFRDPRFDLLQAQELLQLTISISVLTPSEPMQFESESDLIQQLKPGKDGLILYEGNSKGTFLPYVWEQLPNAKDFLQHLKMKAGLASDYWSKTIKVSRYTTVSFSESDV